MRIIQFTEKEFDGLTEKTREALDLSTLRIKEEHPNSKFALENLHRAFNYHVVSLMNMLRDA